MSQSSSPSSRTKVLVSTAIAAVCTAMSFHAHAQSATEPKGQPDLQPVSQAQSDADKLLNLGVFSKFYYGGDANVTASHVEASIGSAAYKIATSQMPKGSKIIGSMTTRISILPFLLRGTTEEKLLGKLEENLTAKLPYIEGLVAQKLALQPGFSDLPAAVRTATITKVVGDQVAAIRKAKAESINGKIDALQLETSLQSVYVTAAHKQGEGMFYIQLGKMSVGGGLPEDVNGENKIDALTPSKSLILNSTSTASTGAVRGGFKTNLPNGEGRLTIDGFVFHNRLAFLNVEDYVGKIANMTEEAFAKHKSWYRIDSALLRTMIETPDLTLYVTIGVFDQDFALSGGGTYNIDERDSFTIVGTTGSRPDLSGGVAVYFTHKHNEALSMYAGLEKAKNVSDPLISLEEKMKRTSVFLGAQYKMNLVKVVKTSVFAQLGVQNNSAMANQVGQPNAVKGSVGIKLNVGTRKKPVRAIQKL